MPVQCLHRKPIAADAGNPGHRQRQLSLSGSDFGDKFSPALANCIAPVSLSLSGPYVPLRVFSCFTMLEGAIEPKAIAKHAARLGFPAAALVDRNGLYAAMPFGEACTKEGVQPIVGAMLGVSRPADIGPKGKLDWLVLLAQDETGYSNLCKLVSAAHLDRPISEDPHVPFEALAGHCDGLIALTAGGEGALARLFADGQSDKAHAYARRLIHLFPGRLYVELSRRSDSTRSRPKRRDRLPMPRTCRRRDQPAHYAGPESMPPRCQRASQFDLSKMATPPGQHRNLLKPAAHEPVRRSPNDRNTCRHAQRCAMAAPSRPTCRGSATTR